MVAGNFVPGLRFFGLQELRQIYETSCRNPPVNPLENLLAALSITYEVTAPGLELVPKVGPLLAVANHPFGLLEGVLLSVLLPRIRPDVKILANSILAEVPELRERCIFIDPFGRKDSIPSNARALRESLAWLRHGGMLVTFPAGEVAQPDWRCQTPADPPWHPAVGSLAKRAGAAAVPIFFAGSNSWAFQLAGMVHPSLRTASLPRELLNKQGKHFVIRVGRPVSPVTIQSLPARRHVIDYLRLRTYALENAGSAVPRLRFFPKPLATRRLHPITAPALPTTIAAEIGRLAPDRQLGESGNLAVCLATRDEMPAVVREIGRLREIAFRAVGEGTGRAVDLDRFDSYYLHLVLWDRSAGQVVGAYRLGPTLDILPKYGIRGLYTSTLFRYDRRLFRQIGPAIELGRSFIRPEYQKQYAPLFLLWKGIARYAAGRPECSRLFGAVSVSNAYHPVSRHLIVQFLQTRRAEDLQRLILPRSPYQPGRQLRDTGICPPWADDIEELSNLIAEFENDRKGVPILVKQYLKAGGKLLGFNVDRRFSGALDALIMVDLRAAPRPLLERYLGKSGAARFEASDCGTK
jgi:putative hemolysin